MGIPYSREINAAFEQVTPLVAAGFKVLRTMKDISILLAVIQVLTVLSLMMILFVLILLLYSVNPDLEVRGRRVDRESYTNVPQHERQTLVTPLLQYLASITFWDVFKGLVTPVVGTALVLGGTWWIFRLRHAEQHELERTADEEADEALENISDGGDKPKPKSKTKGKGKKNKGKEAKNEKETAAADEEDGS